MGEDQLPLLAACRLIENTDSHSSLNPTPTRRVQLNHNHAHVYATHPPGGTSLITETVGGVGFFFLFCFETSSSQLVSQEAPPSPPWRGSILGRRLELCTRRRFGGGHDLHVLCEDGLEGFVSVNHGTKHQWLGEKKNTYADDNNIKTLTVLLTSLLCITRSHLEYKRHLLCGRSCYGDTHPTSW